LVKLACCLREISKDIRRAFSLYTVDDSNIGIARIVRPICDKAIRSHDRHLAAIEPKERTAEKITTLALEDVAEFNPDDILQKIKSKIGFY
jgi:hypothetical protein